MLSWQKKCDVFLLELYLAIDPCNSASKNDVTRLAELTDALAKINSGLWRVFRLVAPLQNFSLLMRERKFL